MTNTYTIEAVKVVKAKLISSIMMNMRVEKKKRKRQIIIRRRTKIRYLQVTNSVGQVPTMKQEQKTIVRIEKRKFI